MPRSVKPAQHTPVRVVAIQRIVQALLFVVLIAVVYRYCWIDASDPFKCGALLSKGQWLDPGSSWETRKNTLENWQPPGCMMHTYEREDIKDCFKKRRLVFIGDSTTRQIFFAVARKMDQERAEEGIDELMEMEQKHMDLEFVLDEVTLQFIWDPWMNSTGLDNELSKFRPNPTGEEDDESAGLILLGAPGLWYARHGQDNFFRDFKEAVDKVIPFMDHSTPEETMIPMEKPFPIRKQSPNFLLMAPIQVPWYQWLSPSREATITPEKIDLMNDYLQQASAYSSADVVWSYSLMTWSGQGEYEESGLHVVDNVARSKADVLLNLRCNADAASKGYPYNRTCCTNYTKPVAIQWLFIFVGMLAIPSLSYLVRRNHIIRISRFLPSMDIMGALTTLTLAICYCFYADRTQVFEKAQKQFQENEFFFACGSIGIAGLLTIRKSQGTGSPLRTVRHQTQSSAFLSRDQTDEWKGWMQAIILIYHYTHGSATLWIYEIIRVLVASYLFMTGFGHTLYFLRTGDFSFERVAKVLLRLNLFSCILPYMMRTDYMFYYFAPLVSFWFLVVFLTLRIGQAGNSNSWYLIGKVVLAALLTTALITVPGILELAGTVLRYTCGISWSMAEWRFRCFLDMYIVYVGMLVAILQHRRTQIEGAALDPTNLVDELLCGVITFPRTFRAINVCASLIFLPGFWLLTRRSPDKMDYNWWMPFISWIPIVSFITLRNCHSVLRNYHSTFFAWLGHISLEAYVLQYHIWLAGDTHGLLRIGVWSRLTETAVLTSIFIWSSWRVAGALQKLTDWIVSGSELAARGLSMPYANEHKPNWTSLWVPSALPIEETTPSKDLRMKFGPGTAGGWMAMVIMKLRTGSKWRLGLLIAALWIGSVAS
ncbi:putative cas1-containing protein [Coleophoma cylindrospora]|uniref:Putative cas1-containing protein n=1 Tax=Coleophoma cylindrospora TaxID=1849047 RepID=A0A3D8SEI1_9HELO|nr:putative cas1-containing protein [Coleophoma cylindrospora]